MESINFVHDVNTLRKTMKDVYSASADLRALNSEAGESSPGNCRVQVLPVVWRHLLDFPKRRQKKGEFDLGETADEEDECKHIQTEYQVPDIDMIQIPPSRTSQLKGWPLHDR